METVNVLCGGRTQCVHICEVKLVPQIVFVKTPL